MAGILMPAWFFWSSIGAFAISMVLGIIIVVNHFEWKKWCPEGIAMKYARKRGGYVTCNHYASGEADIELGKREKVKKYMEKPNWFGKTKIKFIPEEGSGYVEYLPKGLKIIHYIGTHPGPKKILGVRAIQQMAEDYPKIFSEENPKRRIAYRFLTVPEQQLLEDRPYEIQENPELFNEVMDIKAEITGATTKYHLQPNIERMVDEIDAKKYRKEEITIEDFMEVLVVEPPKDDAGNPIKKMVTTGKLLFSELVDVILDPATTANIANAFSIIEANTRRREANRQSEMMGYGFLILMVCLGVGVLIYMVFSINKGKIF